jgi:hypothetical protein
MKQSGFKLALGISFQLKKIFYVQHSETKDLVKVNRERYIFHEYEKTSTGIKVHISWSF